MASTNRVAGIHISITGNSVDFRKAVKSARSEIWKLKSAFAPLTSAARTAGLALAATGGAALLMGKNLAEGIDRLGKLSTSLNTTVADLQAFEMVAGLQGVDFTKATNGLKKLQVVVGQISSGRAYSEVTEEWDKLGLKIEDVVNLPIVQQFERITEAIRNMVPAGEQAATASAFFGTRNATDVMRMTTATFDQARVALKKYGITLSQTAARDTEAMNDAMLVLSLIFKNFARNLVAEHAPAVKAWVQQVQEALRPGGRFRELLERLATGFRMAAQATVEFVDIMSRVVTRERAMTAAMAAMLLAGTRIVLMLGGAAVAAGKFTMAMIKGQSVASGFAVVLGLLKGGIGGLVLTLGALGTAVAAGVAVYRTLNAEFEKTRTSIDGITSSSRAGLKVDIERFKLRAAFLEAGIMQSPEMAALSAEAEELDRKRADLLDLRRRMSEQEAAGNKFPKSTWNRLDSEIGRVGRDRGDVDRRRAAMFNEVDMIRAEAEEAEQRLSAMGTVVSGEVAPALEEAGEKMSDFGVIAKTAFEKMEGSYSAWFDRYREGMADMGDIFDTFAKEALKQLVRLWAFQPAMSVFGGGLGFAGVPGFAGGGRHRGGARIVGEHGPELEVTGPSRIYSAQDTRRMLGGAGAMDINITVGGNRDDIRNQIDGTHHRDGAADRQRGGRPGDHGRGPTEHPQQPHQGGAVMPLISFPSVNIGRHPDDSADTVLTLPVDRTELVLDTPGRIVHENPETRDVIVINRGPSLWTLTLTFGAVEVGSELHTEFERWLSRMHDLRNYAPIPLGSRVYVPPVPLARGQPHNHVNIQQCSKP